MAVSVLDLDREAEIRKEGVSLADASRHEALTGAYASLDARICATILEIGARAEGGIASRADDSSRPPATNEEEMTSNPGSEQTSPEGHRAASRKPAAIAARGLRRRHFGIGRGFGIVGCALIAGFYGFALTAPAVAVAAEPDQQTGAEMNAKSATRAPTPAQDIGSEQGIPLPAPGDPAWKPLLFRSIERPTRFEVRADPQGHPAFRAVSDCGASALLLQLPADFDLERTPRLAWRWRIEKGIEVKAEQTEDGDDFAARVYVLHGFDAERASPWQRMEHKMGRALFGAETPGETINYVWASQVPRGDSWTSPSRDEAKILALESNSWAGDAATWREAIVDLPRDSQKLFSPAPRKAPYAIGLMADADGICELAVAWFSDFRLLGPDPAHASP
ncbi:MAG: DUF3047 domain-containing protein [Myxococcota bacterium]